MPRNFVAGAARVFVHASDRDLAVAAAGQAREVIVAAIDSRGTANVMLATGNSQLGFLAELVVSEGVEWQRVTAFHMDEYVGMGADHPASFRRYLRERVEAKVPLREFLYLRGDAPDTAAETERYVDLLAAHPLDLCVLGIGENGHLAFNDPPVADFDDPVTVKVVALDHACRAQQVGEGHFATIDAVPTHALTVTIPALVAARAVIVNAPEARKSRPVRDALEGPITTACPASVLRRHSHATIHLDEHSAAELVRPAG
jgi:glucosamine-6-phosphate deaminase